MSKGCAITDCPLHGKIEVPYAGNTAGKVVWVGESPGAQEEREGVPFYGESGEMSRKCCTKAGIPWSSLFILNSARCRIDKKALPTKQITNVLKLCRSKVIRALKYIKPKLIIVSGDFAMRQILKKSGITKARGRWV